MTKHTNMIGKVFSRLEVISELAKVGYIRKFECKCSCGNLTTVSLPSLTQGKTRSCGCLRKETVSIRRTKHGATKSDLKSTFTIWVGMRSRCTNPKNARYHVYGARGITIDPRWSEFSNFLSDMGKCPEGYSIERSDNNKGYNKDNCYWLPRDKQALNRQDSINILYEEQIWCLKSLCTYLGKAYLKVYKRYIMRGWELHKALDITDSEVKDLKRLD